MRKPTQMQAFDALCSTAMDGGPQGGSTCEQLRACSPGLRANAHRNRPGSLDVKDSPQGAQLAQHQQGTVGRKDRVRLQVHEHLPVALERQDAHAMPAADVKLAWGLTHPTAWR